MSADASENRPGTPVTTVKRRVPRWWKRLLFVVAAGFTLLALLVAWENWRGHRAWKSYMADLRQRGEPVFLSDIIPAAVPDERNFAGTPFWKGLFATNNAGAYTSARMPDRMGKAQTLLNRMAKDKGEETVQPKEWDGYSLAAWAAALAYATNPVTSQTEIPMEAIAALRQEGRPARVILEHLKDYDSILDEIQAAAARPKARYPIAYDTPNPAMILLPHLAPIKNLCRTLNFRAVARAADGDKAGAQADLNLALHVGDTLRDEPTLIAMLVRIACWRLTLAASQNCWKLGPAWTDEELQQWQRRLEQADFQADGVRTMAGERCFGNGVFEYMKQGHRHILDAFESDPGGDESDPLASAAVRLVPQGWLCLEQVSYNRLFDDYLLIPTPTESPRFRSAAARERESQMEAALKFGPWSALWHHRVFSAMLLPALGRFQVKMAEMQAVLEMAELAAALERHRLAEGSYPQNLSALAPKFVEKVPDDVVSDQPYRYERVGEGDYRLYSIGANGVDDGGEKKTGRDAGDWVWRTVAK